MLAMATVTAGLMWPPDTPPLTNIPRIAPIAHLEKTQYTKLVHAHNNSTKVLTLRIYL